MNQIVSRHILKDTVWLVASLFIASAVTACVTINIYFPAAAAEKAADKVIDEIWQTPNVPSNDPTSDPPTTPAGTLPANQESTQ